MAELRIRIRVSVPLARWGLIGLLLSVFATELSTEKFNLSTYYPAPSGVYARMIATQDATLTRDGGAVGIYTTCPAAGVKLDVNGAARIGGNLQAGGISPAGDISAGNIAAASLSSAGDVKAFNSSIITDCGGSNGIACSTAGNTITINGCQPAPGSCAGCAPACGGTCSGQDSCGNPCMIQGPACCVPQPCSAQMPSCGQACGDDGCGHACCVSAQPCAKYIATFDTVLPVCDRAKVSTLAGNTPQQLGFLCKDGSTPKNFRCTSFDITWPTWCAMQKANWHCSISADCYYLLSAVLAGTGCAENL